MPKKWPSTYFGLSLLALACSTGCGAADPAAEHPAPSSADAPISGYQAEVAKFRQDREATLKSDAGWLTIGGLWFLTQPQTTFGSDSFERHRLSGERARTCGHLGAEKRQGHRQGGGRGHVSTRGTPVTSTELRPDVPGPADRLSLGKDLQFWVHNSGDRLSIRLRDQNNPLRQRFRGLSWFPVDERYRVEATYKPYDKPKIARSAEHSGRHRQGADSRHRRPLR